MSILRALFRRNRGEQHRSSALAMPLFPHTSPPDISAAISWARQQFPDYAEIGQPEGSDSTYTAPIPGGQIGLTHVPAAVPSGDLDGPIALAWHWPEASAIVSKHSAHEICFAGSSRLTSLELRLLHSRFVAGLVATSGASAVYVGSALLVREGGTYVTELLESSRENLPLFAWLGFNPVNEGETRSAYTTGLRDFGLLELEVRNSTLEWSELLGFMADIAHYEIASGIQIGDGETIGGSEDERIVVRHTASRFIPEIEVACIAT